MLDAELLKREFPQEPGLIYLNHAAVAPWPARTAEAVTAFARENIQYGASRYQNWIATENRLRKQLQQLINAPDEADIALLKNTSEGISIVAEGIPWRAGDNVVSAEEEFPSNRIPWQAQSRRGVELRQVNLHTPAPEAALIAACDSHTRLLSISSVQYASGLRMDLTRLGSFCREHDILFCVDGIQSIGAMGLDVQAIQADFVVADAHKWMLGPEGIALFYAGAAAREQLTLHQYGWHMVENAGNYEDKTWTPARSGRRFECGSNNLMGIHALSASLSLLEEIGMDRIEESVLDNSRYLLDRLKGVQGIELITPDRANAYAGIVSFRIPGKDPETVHRALLEKAVICACRGGGIRFSPHFYIGRELLDKALEILSVSIWFNE